MRSLIRAILLKYFTDFLEQIILKCFERISVQQKTDIFCSHIFNLCQVVFIDSLFVQKKCNRFKQQVLSKVFLFSLSVSSNVSFLQSNLSFGSVPQSYFCWKQIFSVNISLYIFYFMFYFVYKVCFHKIFI